MQKGVQCFIGFRKFRFRLGGFVNGLGCIGFRVQGRARRENCAEQVPPVFSHLGLRVLLRAALNSEAHKPGFRYLVFSGLTCPKNLQIMCVHVLF